MSTVKKPRPSLLRFALKFGSVLILAAVSWLVFYSVFLNPTSRLAITYHELDIHSGRTREVDYDWWIRRERTPEETWVSKALTRSKVPPAAPEWKYYGCKVRYPALVKTCTSGRWTGAYLNLRSIVSVVQLRTFTADAETAIAGRLVDRWSKDLERRAWDDYTTALMGWLIDTPDETPITSDMVADFHVRFDESSKTAAEAEKRLKSSDSNETPNR